MKSVIFSKQIWPYFDSYTKLEKEFRSKLTYSRASHTADFGDKKNQCIWKTVYCGLLYRKNVYLQNFCIHFIV